ncbi:MAG: nucleotidyltransferase domain-containing protein [Anaerolineales bacterium]|nr:nucleotidyltransferase domain-containing protein [Anaerolineales bacterium]
MPVKVKRLLKELKNGLVRICGDRLNGLYLYGSYARGDAQVDSDVDVMIVLDGYKSYWEELKRTSELIGDVSLDHNITVSRIIMTEEQWLHSDTPLLHNIRAQGWPA